MKYTGFYMYLKAELFQRLIHISYQNRLGRNIKLLLNSTKMS